MITCLHCRGAETSNGLALCDLCQRFARSIFEHLPIYFRNLARWRPGRAGSRPVPGSRVLYDGEPQGAGDRVTRALDEASNSLTTWARMLVDHRPYLERLLDRLADADLTEAETVAWLCRGFDKYLGSLATLDWCGEFVRELGKIETTLRLLTEDVAPGWYAGGCKGKGCEFGVYVVPGLTWVTCRGCGTTSASRDHLKVVLDEARDWVARPKRISEAIVALVDTEQSVPKLHDRIRQWAARDRIEGVRRVDDEGDEVGPKRFRLGDVLDLLRSEGSTRLRVREGERMQA